MSTVEPNLSFERESKAALFAHQSAVRARLELTTRDGARLPAAGNSRDAYLLAVWVVLLYKHSGHTDLSVGIARADGSLQRIRVAVDSSRPFEDCVEATERAQADRLSCTSLRNAFTFGALEIPLSDLGITDLHIAVQIDGRAITSRLAYDANQFSQAAAERLLHAYHDILRQVLRAERRMCEIELISQPERDLLLAKFNATETAFESDTFHGLFERQARRVPNAVAVADERRTLTYAELNAEANQLAHHLLAKGLAANTVVGVLLGRRAEAIVAMLGIMKAGAGYLPIEPRFPAPRIRYMLEDSRCAFAITDDASAGNLPAVVQPVDIDAKALRREMDTNPSLPRQPNDLAYVIYTSGSTGEPKGVPIHHEGVANLHQIFREKFQIDENDRMIEFASFSFDTSVWEIVMCMLAGASMHILSDALKANYSKLEQYLAEHRITVATFPPTYLAYIDPDHVPSLRAVAVAGSECSAKLLKRWNTRVRFHNAYGPTEHSVCIAVFDAPTTPYDRDVVPIGRPLFNKRIYVVGPDSQLQPIGAPGELWVSGVGMSRGYLGQPELTATRFVDNPFPVTGRYAERHRVAYRTGDLARWREDGMLEFIGRLDNQVKVRGYRIELDEVDSALLRIAGVEQAAAVVRKDAEGSNVLHAFYTSSNGMTASEFRSALAATVPDHMIPSRLIRAAALPMTNSDKVDRRALTALPEPAELSAAVITSVTATQADATTQSVESALTNVLQGAGRSSEVDIAASLEVLGIDSLLFMKIVVQLETEYDLEFDEDFLLEGRSMTVKQIAELIDARRAAA